MYTSISSRRDRRHIFPRNSTDFGGETVVRKKKKKKMHSKVVSRCAESISPLEIPEIISDEIRIANGN